MKKLAIVLSICSLFAVSANADVIAYWAENANDLPGGLFGFEVGDFPQGADYGAQAGSAALTPGGGDVYANDGTTYTWLQSFSGSTVNAQFGEPSGGSISIQGGTDQVNNGSWFDFSFDATNWENITFSYAGRRTSTGFNDVDIDVYDGASLVGNLVSNLDMTTSTTLQLYSYNTALLDGVTDAHVRMTFNGSTSATGNFRIDNMLIEGTQVPEPASLVLIGLAGLFLRRR